MSDDERIAKRADNGSARANRISEDRAITEDRETSDSVRRRERQAMLRDANTLLPPAPDIPGFHTCWLTTTNNRDSLETRFSRGYTLVKRDELPGFALASQKSGDVTDDRITVNEMVLAKIPTDLWREDTIYLHHDLPTEWANNLRDSVKFSIDGKGRRVAYSGGEFQNGVSDGGGFR